jgi:large subunit ribosomal protein L9
MKVLLLEDVYNLGRAGEIKKVANGYGRNYLIPQGLAVLATPGALAQVERIREEADKKRTLLNEEMSVVAEKLADVKLLFAAKAGETGKLYGSVTTQMIAEKLSSELGVEISKRQIDSQPLRLLGMHTIKARLTIDLIPEFKVVVYREGESPENYMISAEELADESPALVEEVDAAPEAELEAESAVEAEADAETVDTVAEEAAEEAAPEAVAPVDEPEETADETE